MPEAFVGDGTEGQRTEKVDQKDFRYVKELSFAERFKLPTVAPIIYGGFGVAGQGDNILNGHDILSLLSPLISLQNRQKCRFEPTLKKCSCNKASRAKKPYFKRLSAQTKRPETGTKRPEVDTLTKRLEIS